MDNLPDLSPAQEKLLHRLAKQSSDGGEPVDYLGIDELSEVGHLVILRLAYADGKPPRLKITERGMRIAYLRSIT